MKILVMVPDFPPEEIGGTEIFTKDLAVNLSTRHNVTVLTSGQRKREIVNNNLVVLRTPKFFKNRVLYNIKETLYFIRKSFSFKTDIILGHMVTSAGLAAIISGVLRRKPVVLRLSGCEFRYPWWSKKLFLNPLLRLASGIITINGDMKKEISHLNRNVVTLPQGMSVTKHLPLKKEKGRPKILFVGRLVQFKNIDMLLDVARVLEDFEFVIVGDGPERKKIKRANLKNVLFVGKQRPAKVIEFMRSSDVFINTSFTEPFGRVFLEAMSCGLPIVANNKGGPKDIIQQGRNGYVVDNYDVQKMAACIKKALENKEEISKNNLSDIDRFDWSNLLKEYEDFYSKFTKRGRSR